MRDDELAGALPPAPPPPDDLATRVLARVHRRGHGRAWGWLALEGIALAALVAIALATGGARWSGDVEVVRRTTVAIGPRAVAVAEAGARLRYTVEHAARVEQRAGTVFYRVAPGGPFVVATPAGEVRVTGTCFRVEVDPMTSNRKAIVAGAAGAALAALVTVTVYEGRVVLAGTSGSRRALVAGEQGRMDSPTVPTPTTKATATTATTAAAGPVAALDPTRAKAAIGDDPVALRARVADLETQVSALRSQLGEAARGSGETRRVSPSAEDLKGWAARCEIHVDAPDVWGSTPSALTAQRIAEWGLSADEAAVMDQVNAELHAQALAQLRRIYALATGEAGGGDLAAGALWGEIMDKSDAATQAEARRRMALERAGLAPPPADVTTRPPVEQALRLIATLGAETERMTAAQLGEARARELRERYNGWPGMRMDTDGCPTP